jgi:hypothetical protein
MPQIWRMDYGPRYGEARVITLEPPRLGAPYQILVPQVDADGNDVSGVRLPEVAVPLGTYTGWNITVPQLNDLGYLSGLVGGFEPFPLTRDLREKSHDVRMSIAERYAGRQDYLERVKRTGDDLVRQRFILGADVSAVVRRAGQIWDVLINAPSPQTVMPEKRLYHRPSGTSGARPSIGFHGRCAVLRESEIRRRAADVVRQVFGPPTWLVCAPGSRGAPADVQPKVNL